MSGFASKFRRRVLAARQPDGLVVRSVLLAESPQQKEHRRLLRSSNPSAPRILAWPLLLWRALRWRWTSRAAISTFSDRFGSGVQRTHGVPIAEQQTAMQDLVRSSGISPRDYYWFRLFEPEQFDRRWSYVYDCEVAAFHASRNQFGAVVGDLSDKQLNAERFEAAGIPTAATLAELAKGSTWRDLPDQGESVMFCKPRSGSAARGVFRVQRSGARIEAWRLGGRAIEEPADFVDRRLASADYLVQPYYDTHEELADLGASAVEALTVRLITERTEHGDIVPYCAFLEVPVRSSDRNGYVPIEINSFTGRVERVAPRPYGFEPGVVSRLQDHAKDRLLPGWSEMLNHAIRAHHLIEGRWAIAWDFVISPGGPVLLEGNANWALTVPQLFRGPLLARLET